MWEEANANSSSQILCHSKGYVFKYQIYLHTLAEFLGGNIFIFGSAYIPQKLSHGKISGRKIKSSFPAYITEFTQAMLNTHSWNHTAAYSHFTKCHLQMKWIKDLQGNTIQSWHRPEDFSACVLILQLDWVIINTWMIACFYWVLVSATYLTILRNINNGLSQLGWITQHSPRVCGNPGYEKNKA